MLGSSVQALLPDWAEWALDALLITTCLLAAYGMMADDGRGKREIKSEDYSIIDYSIVVLRAVDSRPELNGLTGTVVSSKQQDDGDGRYSVRPAGHEPIALKPSAFEVLLVVPPTSKKLHRALRLLAKGRTQQAFELSSAVIDKTPYDWKALTVRAVIATSFGEPQADLNVRLASKLFAQAASATKRDGPSKRQKAMLQSLAEQCRQLLGDADPDYRIFSDRQIETLLQNFAVPREQVLGDNNPDNRDISGGATATTYSSNAVEEDNDAQQAEYEAAVAETKKRPDDWRAWANRAEALLAIEPSYVVNVAAAYCCYERALFCLSGFGRRVVEPELRRRMEKTKNAVSRDSISTARDYLVLNG